MNYVSNKDKREFSALEPKIIYALIRPRWRGLNITIRRGYGEYVYKASDDSGECVEITIVVVEIR